MEKKENSTTKHETAVRTEKVKGGIWAHPLTGEEIVSIFASPLPPVMPEDCLPRPVKAALWNTPSLYRPSFSQCVFPAFGALTSDLSFTYTNNIDYEPRLNVVQVIPSGLGKNPVSTIYNHILTPVRDKKF